MANLNRVFLIGNLTRDVELRFTPRGTAVAEIGLAINRTWTDEDKQKREDVTFVDVTLWARLAETASQYTRKGSPLFIEGRLQLDSWDDKQTGQKRSRLRVIGENLQLLGGKEKPALSAPAPDRGPTPQPRRPEVPAPALDKPPF
jgi:single-strand DNA-binding protein